MIGQWGLTQEYDNQPARIGRQIEHSAPQPLVVVELVKHAPRAAGPHVLSRELEQRLADHYEVSVLR